MLPSILITGATGNLGASVLHQLAGLGYPILATASSAAAAHSLQRPGVSATALDLTDEQAVSTYVKTISADHDIAAAILLVGGFATGSLPDTSGADLRRMILLNVETAFYLVRELLPVFGQRGGGQCIFIGARPALVPAEGQHLTAYALSKGMVFQLADIVNAYGHDKRIDATVIVPGTLDTAANRQAMPDADPTRWVKPEIVADTIAFVLSEAGQQLRGTVLKLYHES